MPDVWQTFQGGICPEKYQLNQIVFQMADYQPLLTLISVISGNRARQLDH